MFSIPSRVTLFSLHLSLLTLLLCLVPFVPRASETAPSPRERISIDKDWRFTKNDPPEVGDKLQYQKIKAWLKPTGADFTSGSSTVSKKMPGGNPGGIDISYTQSAFDDSNWRKVDLPHDWGIEGPFNEDYPGATGKLPWWGVAWYRKQLDIPVSDKGRKISLDVDGAMSYSAVWLNGHFVGGWPYGYASWRVDLTPYLNYGGKNVLAIRLDNPPESSRWYPGGGIYRNVWLVKTAPVHVAHWGTYVTTPEASAASATVAIAVKIQNESTSESEVTLKNALFELKTDGSKGVQIGVISLGGIKIPAGECQISENHISFANPKLWSLKAPNRYIVETTIEQDGKSVDSYETPFGIRTIQFTGDNGFLLNGKRVQINGVCNHHDLGALGSAINVRAMQRQIEIMKQMGCNAIRTSHNPPAPELLDLCDQMGILVMDEGFDAWVKPKRTNDYHLLFKDWHEMDWRAQLRRDRNHPSVIIWSIGNEIPDETTSAGIKIGHKLTNIAHQEDPTRPTSSACNRVPEGYNGFQDAVDVFGYNYRPFTYAPFHQAHPQKPLYGSETASCVSSRGEYFFPLSDKLDEGKADFQVSSYDLLYPGWATSPDMEFKGLDENPTVAGEFVWTGFDYLGEPTPYNKDSSNLLNFTDPADKAKMQKEMDKLGKIHVPSRSSYFGIVDLAGFPKDRFYLYQARWRPDLPMAHILPHWNWPDRVGQVTPVHVYTSGDEAELFLNGKSLGRKKKAPLEYRIRWDDAVYQPGELKVVAYKNGKEWATDTVKTTGKPAKLALEADRTSITADGKDLSFITLRVQDTAGLMVPRSKNRIKFAIEGPGEIVATDNGDATCLESFQSPERDAFNGLALAIVRSREGKAGSIKITATSEGLQPATVKISSR